MKNLLSKTNLIITLITIFSLICAYTFGINPFFTFIIILFVLIFSNTNQKIEKNILWIIIPIIILFTILLLPDFIYPTVHSDFYNHASNSRIIAENTVFDSIEHSYPRGTHALLAALIQISPLNFFVTTSIVSVIIYILSIINFNQLSNKIIKDNKKALLATIIFAFSITTIWNLQLGFIPSVLGFYLIINTLLYEKDNKILSILNGGTLATVYPHYFGILCLYYLVKGFFKKEILTSILKIIGFLLIGGFEFTLSLLGVLIFHSDTAVLMKGGIFAPNIFFLIYFIILVIFSLRKFKFSDLISNELLLFFSILFLQIVLSFAVIINWLLDITGIVTLKQFYMVVKLFYLQMIPLSIFFAKKINISGRNLAIFGTILLVFFSGYVFYINSNYFIESEVFEIGQVISNIIPANSTISLDPVLLETTINNPPPYYDSIVRLSSDYSEISRINLEKSLRADWMEFTGNGFYYEDNIVFIYNLTGDYYIGYQNIGGELLYKTNQLFVFSR